MLFVVQQKQKTAVSGWDFAPVRAGGADDTLPDLLFWGRANALPRSLHPHYLWM